ncbi:alpha/beta hydrolase [Allohahella marinimesophila]|uniref:Alpha/beta hydrolase n=1 Tax=Allohahella marinimesophila TaxID=1054972 RepID=A0ABP7NWA2_9GAMM
MQRLLHTLLLAAALPALAADEPAYGPRLEGFDYPHPVKKFELDSQGQTLEMAYMDIKPAKPNGETVVLLHGKNFCAATWESTITTLTGAGYRVIAPDQIGFCKSSKPEHYQFSFHQLSANTSALLSSLGIERHSVMGHSMGGMLATRHALLNPEQVKQLILVNPIGLEDWIAKGVPYRSIDSWYESELNASAEGMRKYQKSTYYAGTWRPEFDRWVDMRAGMFRGEGREAVAWNSALTYDMILTQPVVYEFDQLKPPTLLLIGEQDNTAVGKATASPEQQKTLGQYPQISQDAAERIPNATLVSFEDLGHSPQIQAPERFHEALLGYLQGSDS